MYFIQMRAGNVPRETGRRNVFTKQFLKSFANRAGFLLRRELRFTRAKRKTTNVKIIYIKLRVHVVFDEYYEHASF